MLRISERNLTTSDRLTASLKQPVPDKQQMTRVRPPKQAMSTFHTKHYEDSINKVPLDKLRSHKYEAMPYKSACLFLTFLFGNTCRNTIFPTCSSCQYIISNHINGYGSRMFLNISKIIFFYTNLKIIFIYNSVRTSHTI